MAGKLMTNSWMWMMVWFALFTWIFFGFNPYLYILISLIAIGYPIHRKWKYNKENPVEEIPSEVTMPNPADAEPEREHPGKNDKYAKAIEAGETADFLLGRGRYLYPDDEWAGIHTPSLTFRDIFEYGEKEGFEALLEQFAKDIDTALAGNLSTLDLILLKTYIWIYIRTQKEDGKGLVEWTVADSTKILFRQQLEKFISLYGTAGGEFKRNSENNEFNVVQLLSGVKIINERFGVNLMQ